MSLAWKIALSAGLPVAVFVGATGMGLRALDAAGADTRRTLDRVVAAARETAAARDTAITAVRLHGRWSALPDLVSERLWTTRMGELDHRLGTLAVLLTPDVPRLRIAKAARAFGRYRVLASTERDGRIELRPLSSAAMQASARARRTLGTIGSALEASSDAARTEELGLEQEMQELLRAAAGVAALLAVLLSGWTAFRVARALRRLTWASEALERGRLDEPVAIGGGDELAELATSFETLALELRERDRIGDQLVHRLGNELEAPLRAIHDTTRTLDADLAEIGTVEQRRLAAAIAGDAGELLRRTARIADARPDAAALPYVAPPRLAFAPPGLLADRTRSEGSSGAPFPRARPSLRP